MTVERLLRDTWEVCFTLLRAERCCQEVQIEVVSAESGYHIDADWELCEDVHYDKSRNEIRIVTKNVGHLIRTPAELFVDRNVGGRAVFGAIDDQGMKYVLAFRDALLLDEQSA